MLKRIIAVLGMLGFAFSAGAAEFKVVGNSAPSITISGYIEAKDDERFAQIANANPWASVVLNSPGGHVVAAIEIGRKVRSKKFSTVVGARQLCASACGLIWLAGREKFLFTSSKVGFHAAYTSIGNSFDVSAAGNALVGGYLRDLGYSDAVIIYASTAMPRGMQWLNADDADRLGIAYMPLRDRNDPTNEPDREPEQEFLPAARYTYINGYMLAGAAVGKPIKGVSKVEDCTRQCDLTLDCVAINFDVEDKACLLKTEVVLAVKNKRYKSGYRGDVKLKMSDPSAMTYDPSLDYLLRK